MESSSPKDSGKYLPDSGQTLPKDIATLLGRNSNRSDIQRFNMAKSSNPRGLVGLSNLGNTVSAISLFMDFCVDNSSWSKKIVLHEFNTPMYLLNSSFDGVLYNGNAQV